MTVFIVQMLAGIESVYAERSDAERRMAELLGPTSMGTPLCKPNQVRIIECEVE